MTRTREEGGFTLVELVVAVTLMLSMGLVVSQFFEQALTGSADLQSATLQTADARFAIDQFTRDLRQAYAGTAATTPIISISSQAISFYAPDSRSPYYLRLIAYRIQGTQLQRSVTLSTVSGGAWSAGTTGPWAAVMDARSLTITGYDTDGAATSTAANVHRVDITVAGLNSGGSGADHPYSTSVDLRAV